MSPRRLFAVCGVIVFTRFLLTFPSSWSTYQGFNEVFYVLNAQQLGSNLVPTINGLEHWNTPPLWTWILAAWGRVFGWSEVSMRVPGIIAWAATGPAIHRLGAWARERVAGPGGIPTLAVLLWFTLPFPFLWAGRAQTDMLLTCLLTWGVVLVLEGRHRVLAAVSLLGVFAKQPYAAVALPAALWRNWRGLVAATAPAMLLGAWVLLIGRGDVFAGSLENHVEFRHGGFWQWTELVVHSVFIGTGFVLLIPLFLRPNLRALGPLWVLVGAFLFFSAYAAPPGHTYYFLPAYSALPVLLSVSLHQTLQTQTRPAWVLASLPLLVFILYDAGETWDDRTRELAAYGEVAGVDTNLWAHAQYEYGHTVPALTDAPRPGLNWWFTAYPGCVVLQEKPDWSPKRPTIYLLDCPAALRSGHVDEVSVPGIDQPATDLYH